LDYVLENLADTAKITVNLHEGKTHLVLNDGSGTWREWWYHEGRWKPKTQGNENSFTLPVATSSVLGGVKTGSRVSIAADGAISANPQAWTDITGKPYFSSVATSGSYSDLTNKPAIYTLPPATTSTLGGVKAGNGLYVTGDGTLSTTANDVVCDSFTPTVSGNSSVTYHLTNNSYGRYIRNNRAVYIEIYLRIAKITGTQDSEIVKIYIPLELRLSTNTNIKFSPVICILNHEKIMKDGYTMLGGCLDNYAGRIRLIQYGGDNSAYYVNELKVDSSITLSVNYILY
jgi:hypothetical protein